MQQLAHTTLTGTQISEYRGTRVDLYRPIHKALRALMADTLLNVGRMDPNDNLEMADATNQVLELAAACESHVIHENSFVHPAMEARAPGSATDTTNDHADHLEGILELGRAVSQLRAAPQFKRNDLALSLYHLLSHFVAHNFEHMLVEESRNNTVLWACYSDEELKDLHDDLLESIPPEEMMGLLRWAVPYMNATERVDVLLDVKSHVPAPAFQAVLDMTKPHLRAREWDKLAFALALQ